MNKNIGKKVISGLLLGTMCVYTMPVLANTKDETVYSKVNQNGKNYNTIVSTKLSNDNKSNLLEDLSDLLNIENTNGDETFKKEGEKIIWNANGNKITYQGETEKELPVTMNIRYELDGKEISSEEVVGKSGKVKVIIEYANNEEHTVLVNGRYVKMYTPFVALAGTIINNKKADNIEVDAGKIVDNGNKTIVVGMAAPGMKESLNIKDDSIQIPEKIEISMEAQDFEMSNIITYLTPKVIEEEDLKLLDNVDEIYSKVRTIQDSSKQLVQGANKLKDGTVELNSGAGELSKGINVAYRGVNAMKSEITKATSNLLADKSDALDESTITVIGDSASKTAVEALNTKENGQSKLDLIGTEASKTATQQIKPMLPSIGKEASQTATNEIKSKLTTIGESAKQQVVSSMKDNINVIGAQAKQEAEKAVTGELSSIGKTAEGMVNLTLTEAQKSAITAEVSKQVKESMEKDATFSKLPKEEQELILTYSQKSAVVSAISVAENTLNTTGKTVANKVAQNVAKNVAGSTAETVAKQVAGNVAGDIAKSTAQTVATSVASDVASSTATSTASKVAGSIAGEVAKNVATNVAGEVAGTTAQGVAKQVGNEVKKTAMQTVGSQMNTLVSGLNTLNLGLAQLNDGSIKLLDGVGKLSDGSNSLAEGMTEFDEQAIEKICNYINGDIKDLTERIKALKKLAEEYNTFTKLNDGDNGTVKFIIIADELKKRQ